MKKATLLKGVTILFASFLIASCGNSSSLAPNTSSGSDAPHEHAYSSEHDNYNHWQVCSCGEKTSKQTHEFANVLVEDGVKVTCDTCGYSTTFGKTTCYYARLLADDTETTVEGVVASFTYNSSRDKDGFMLMDDTSSIYIHGGTFLVGLDIGNKVTVKGNKTHYILEEEQPSAAKFGYIGSSQIEASELVSNDKGSHELNGEWTKNRTVKQIMNTPYSSDITTEVYKVNALIKRSPDAGFINYYIDDLDGKTGSYVYTKANGNDIDAQLKEYDGRICTIYLTALNAKSTSTGCVWRFHVVSIIEPDYEFPKPQVPEFVLEYYVADLFDEKYVADPALELPTSVSNDDIPFNNVTVSYTSNNNGVMTVDVEDGKTIMHTHNVGSATLTATATWARSTKTYTASRDFTIVVEEAPQFETITIAEAIAAELNSEVCVKGIVGPGLVNQKGFYLIDNTGLIAIKTSEDIPTTYAMGNEVIIKAKRDLMKETQILLSDVECVVNLKGNHDYSRETFITGKSIAEILAQEYVPELSTKAYITNAVITKTESTYSTNYFIKDVEDNSKSFILYASSDASPYEWLNDYIDEQAHRIEFAICNWNAKPGRACVLSVTNADGSYTYNTNNF